MSTYIDGYRLPKMPVAKLLKFLEEFRRKVRLEAEILVARQLAVDAFKVLDENALGLRTGYGEYARKAVQCATAEWDEAQANLKQRRREPDYDMECELVLIPQPKEWLVVWYSEQKEFRRVWETMPGVREYAFWNATDSTPGGVSYQSFLARGRRWDRILKPYGLVPGQAGFLYPVNASDNPHPWHVYASLIVAHAQPVEKRVRKLAFDTLWQRHYEQHKDSEEFKGQSIFGQIFRLQDQARENPAILEPIIQEITPKLAEPSEAVILTVIPPCPRSTESASSSTSQSPST